MITISEHDLARFEHAKDHFKQQVCLGVDNLFATFLNDLTSRQLSTPPSDTYHPLSGVSHSNQPLNVFADSFVAQQQQQLASSENESLTSQEQSDQHDHNLSAYQPALINVKPLSTPNSNSQGHSLQEHNLFHSSISGHINHPLQNDQTLVDSTNLSIPIHTNWQAHNQQQQPQSHSTIFNIKQEIIDDDEQPIESEFINDNDGDTFQERSENIESDYPFNDNESSLLKQELTHQNRNERSFDLPNETTDNNFQYLLPNTQIDNFQVLNVPPTDTHIDRPQVSFVQSHNLVANIINPVSYSYDDDIYDEELLQEVKEEILEDERNALAKRRRVDLNENDHNETVDVMMQTVGDQNVDPNFKCTFDSTPSDVNSSNQKTVVVEAVNDPSFQSIDDQNINSEQIQNEILVNQSDELEEGELIDSGDDERDISPKNHTAKQTFDGNRNCPMNDIDNEIRNDIIKAFEESRDENKNDESASRASLSDLNFPSFEYDKFRIISLNCPVESCQLPFGTKDKLDFHMAGAHKLLPFQCPFSNCDKVSFLTRRDLTDHFQFDHLNESRWICYQCGHRMDGPLALYTHMIEQHYQGKFECVKDNCGHVSRFRESAIRHYDKAHLSNQTGSHQWSSEVGRRSIRMRAFSEADEGENNEKYRTISLKCFKVDCSSEFSSHIALDDHLRDMHGILTNVCLIDKCDKSFGSRYDLNVHVRVDHKEIEIFHCSKCDFLHQDFDCFNRHNFMCHHPGQFKCTKENCGYVGKSRNETFKHYDNKHWYGRCTLCGLTTTSKIKFNSHQCGQLPIVSSNLVTLQEAHTRLTHQPTSCDTSGE